MQYVGADFREIRKFTHYLNTLYHLQGLISVESGKGTNLPLSINLKSFRIKIKTFDCLHREKSSQVLNGFE